MNIAICDDEQQDIDILYNYCKSCKLPYNISTFLSASALLEAFKSQFYDLIFLDIEMDKPNGFEVGSILAGYSPRPVIVFTTNALQYAVRGYGIAFRFLCKLDIENPIIRINTAFKGCSSLEKISVLPRIYHN